MIPEHRKKGGTHALKTEPKTEGNIRIANERPHTKKHVVDGNGASPYSRGGNSRVSV